MTEEDTRYRILLVEDNKLDQMAFTRFVNSKKLPYDCTVAGSVSEAQGVLRSAQFDIVITDYSLGDGTALNILDLVKDVPVIVITGTGDEEVVASAWKAGAHDYLPKDLERNYLKAIPGRIQKAVEHRKMGEALNRKQKNLEAMFDAVPKLLEEVEKINRELNDLASIVSGDLKTLLRGITVLANSISADCADKPDRRASSRRQTSKP